MLDNHPSIEEVKSLIKQWRANKVHKREPMPDDIKSLVKQLLQQYQPHELTQKLNLHPLTINKMQSQLINSRHQNHHNNNDGQSFVPFKLVPKDQHSQSIQSCQIVNSKGDKLVISAADISIVIKAFLCSN